MGTQMHSNGVISSFVFLKREIPMALRKGLAKPHLECRIHFCSAVIKKDEPKLGQVHGRATRKITGMRNPLFRDFILDKY